MQGYQSRVIGTNREKLAEVVAELNKYLVRQIREIRKWLQTNRPG